MEALQSPGSIPTLTESPFRRNSVAERDQVIRAESRQSPAARNLSDDAAHTAVAANRGCLHTSSTEPRAGTARWRLAD